MTLHYSRCGGNHRQHLYRDAAGAFSHKCLRCGNQHFDYTEDGKWRYPPRQHQAGRSSRTWAVGPEVGVRFQIAFDGQWSRPFRVDRVTAKRLLFSMPSFDTEPATRKMHFDEWQKRLADFSLKVIA